MPGTSLSTIWHKRSRFFFFQLRSAFGIFLFLVSTLSYSQTVKKDSASLHLLPLYHQYMREIGATAHLFNGAEYDGAYPLVLGTPFWNKDGFENGTLCYEGIVYYDVPLAYDLVSGEVLTRGPENQRLRLEKTKLSYFKLAEHTYVYLPADTLSSNSLPEDIYDLLYDGAVKVYAQRLKLVTRGLHATERDRFSSRTNYFVYRDETYYPVDREKDLLRIFRKEEASLKSFWKKNNLDFRKDPEFFILKTVAYWSRLKK